MLWGFVVLCNNINPFIPHNTCNTQFRLFQAEEPYELDDFCQNIIVCQFGFVCYHLIQAVFWLRKIQVHMPSVCPALKFSFSVCPLQCIVLHSVVDAFF
jgi:hypothetical protein